VAIPVEAPHNRDVFTLGVGEIALAIAGQV